MGDPFAIIEWRKQTIESGRKSMEVNKHGGNLETGKTGIKQFKEKRFQNGLQFTMALQYQVNER